MDEKCAYCKKELKGHRIVSKEFYNGITLPPKNKFLCEDCSRLSEIMKDSVIDGIRDFMAQYIFSYYHNRERHEDSVDK